MLLRFAECACTQAQAKLNDFQLTFSSLQASEHLLRHHPAGFLRNLKFKHHPLPRPSSSSRPLRSGEVNRLDSYCIASMDAHQEDHGQILKPLLLEFFAVWFQTKFGCARPPPSAQIRAPTKKASGPDVAYSALNTFRLHPPVS